MSYRIGTISVTNGSKNVVGTNTLFATIGVSAGDQLTLVDANGLATGAMYEVVSVTDNTHLTLLQNYQGTTGSGKAYAIIDMAGDMTVANFARRLAEFYADYSQEASPTHKGLTKLYNTLGQNTDGSVTQKAVTDAIGGTYDLNDWADISAAVKAGMGTTLFPPGYIMPKVAHPVYGDLYFEVQRNYEREQGKYRCVLWLKYGTSQLSSIQFDAQEAFYYANAALPAGTYKFTVATTTGSWAAGTYQFTLTSQLPAKGQLCLNGNYGTALTSLKVQAFASQTTTTATEQVNITSGNSGTSLGTLGVELNHPQRISYGSNNYGESAIRQMLNSAAAAGSVWTPQTKFDRPPSWAASKAGFMAQMPNDFLSVVAVTDINTYTNSVYEAPDSRTPINTVYSTRDRFWLPTRMEVYGSSEGSHPDGTTQYPLMVGTPDAAKIKTLFNGTQVPYYWLRSPYTGDACNVRIEYTPYGGALTSYDAYGSRAALPACEIGS